MTLNANTPPSDASQPQSPQGSGGASHRVFLPDLAFQDTSDLSVSGPEAHHALRVKRLRVGDAVELFDGEGLTLRARYTTSRSSRQNPVMILEPTAEPVSHPPVTPRVEVFCSPPKADRLGPMIDQLSQMGVAAWVPMATARTQGPAHDFKQEKVDRVVVESAKQCGRAWLMQIGEPTFFEHAIELDNTVLFDASGETGPAHPASDTLRLLIGPEGGWAPQELRAAQAAGLATRRAGPHILRLETAAVVAATTVLHQVSPSVGDPA